MWATFLKSKANHITCHPPVTFADKITTNWSDIHHWIDLSFIKSHKTNCLDIKKHRRQSRLLCTKHDILKCLIWHIPLSYTMIHQREDFSPLLTDTSLLSSMYIYVTVEIERQLSFSSLLKSILWNLQQKKKSKDISSLLNLFESQNPFLAPHHFSVRYGGLMQTQHERMWLYGDVLEGRSHWPVLMIVWLHQAKVSNAGWCW